MLDTISHGGENLEQLVSKTTDNIYGYHIVFIFGIFFIWFLLFCQKEII